MQRHNWEELKAQRGAMQEVDERTFLRAAGHLELSVQLACSHATFAAQSVRRSQDNPHAYHSERQNQER